MPIPLPLLRALDSYTRTVWNLGYRSGRDAENEFIATGIQTPSMVPLKGVIPHSHPFSSDCEALHFRLIRAALLSQLEGGQPAPESLSSSASPTNHPDILRADIADLLELLQGLLPSQNCLEDSRTLLRRCRAHIQEL